MKKYFALLICTFFMLGFTFAANAAEGTTVVYVRDGGNGDGSSPDRAVSTLTAAYDALDLSKDCTVVICGIYTQSTHFQHREEFDGSVTLTSVYDGVDYRKNGAVFKFQPTRFFLYGETTFENMDFEALGDYLLIVAAHNPITIGEGVTMTGDKMTGGAVAKSFSILGGYQAGADDPPISSDEDVNITVLSGSKIYIVPFSRSIAGGSYTGTATIEIGGNAHIDTLHGSNAHPSNVTIGDIQVEITDNAIVDEFFGCTDDITANSYEFTWRSGTIGAFYWVCPSTITKKIHINEPTVLNVSEAAKKSPSYLNVAANFEVINDLDAPATSASPTYNCAKALFTLGLAQGYDTTGTNFGLADSLTRVQAVVQVIRFLGMEDTVKASHYTIPFTDVPAWAVNYIGYAYENGITSGRSTTVFDPDGAVDEAQFLTLILRAIGYSDKDGDFVWNDPFALAKRIGMAQNEKADASFNRGNAFTFSWASLSSTAKNGKAVADNLIAEGVFTADAFTTAKNTLQNNNSEENTVIKIACIGDSITYGVGASDLSKNYPSQLSAALGENFEIRNFGISRAYMVDNVEDYPDQIYASTASNSYKQSVLYQRSLSYDADIILICLGANDAYTAQQNPNTFEYYKASAVAMVEKYRALPSNPTVYLMYPPSRFDSATRLENLQKVILPAINAAAKELDCEVIDLYSVLQSEAAARDRSYFGDGIHPTDKGYTELVKVILEKLKTCDKILEQSN